MPDKRKVWEDFLSLIKASDNHVKSVAADALISLFPGMDNKDSLWMELLEFSENEEEDVQSITADILTKVFPYLSLRSEAYSELIRLAETKESSVLQKLVDTLISAYSELCKEREAREWEEIGKRDRREPEEKDFFRDKDKSEAQVKLEKRSKAGEAYETASEKGTFLRKKAANSLSSVLSGENEENGRWQIKEKGRSKLASEPARTEPDSSAYVRKKGMVDLFAGSGSIPDRKEIISKLIRLGSDSDPQRRKAEIEALLAAYSRYNGKVQDIWDELIELTGEEDTGTRRDAADLLKNIFPAVENKSAIFYDLVRLTESQDAYIRKRAAELLAAAFVYSENKQTAWNELVKLVSVEDREVRKGAVLALSSGFAEVPDKGKAWMDLVRLSDHSDSFVQRTAVRVLGSAFFHVPGH